MGRGGGEMEILVLEASTTSAKAMLYHTAEQSFEVKVRAYTGNYEDVSIHDAENVYQHMIGVGRELLNGRQVDMIALSGTWHSLLLCDRGMTPVTPVYLWSYTGAAQICKALRQDQDYVRRFYQKTGCMVNAVYPFFKLLLLKEKGYDLTQHYILGQGSYNNYRMTGRRVNTACIASGSGLLNTWKGAFDPDLLAELGIQEEQLSALVPYNSTFPITQEAAQALGVRPGTPVIPSNSDGGLNQVGAGAVAEGIMTFSVGTSGAIRLTTGRPVLPEEPSTWCYRSPKNWLSGAATNGCCNCLDWYKGQMGLSRMSYVELEKGITDRENTPVFLPFLFGERCPGWNDEREGGFLRVLPRHGLSDLYLAVQEGVLFNLYHCYQILAQVNGRPRHIRFSGGILHSESWSQMCADIFQQELEVNENEHGSLLGGAVLAMELLGVIDDACAYDAEVSRVIRPDPARAELYQRKFQRYLECYQTGR